MINGLIGKRVKVEREKALKRKSVFWVLIKK
jgi:hypothetical protein